MRFKFSIGCALAILFCIANGSAFAFQIDSINAVRWLESADTVRTAEYDFELATCTSPNLLMPLNHEDLTFGPANYRGTYYVDVTRGERVDFEDVNVGENRVRAYVDGKYYSITYERRAMRVSSKDSFHCIFPRLSSFYGDLFERLIDPEITLASVLQNKMHLGPIIDFENGFVIKRAFAESNNQSFYIDYEIHLTDSEPPRIDHILNTASNRHATGKPPSFAYFGEASGQYAQYGVFFRELRVADTVEYASEIYKCSESPRGWGLYRLKIDPRTVRINQPLSQPLIPSRPDGFAYTNAFTGERIEDSLKGKNRPESKPRGSAIENAIVENIGNAQAPPQEVVQSEIRRKQDWSTTSRVIYGGSILAISLCLLFFIRSRFFVVLPFLALVNVACTRSHEIPVGHEFTNARLPTPAIELPVRVLFNDSPGATSKIISIPFDITDAHGFIFDSSRIRTTCGCTSARWEELNNERSLRIEIQRPTGSSVKFVEITAPILDQNQRVVDEIRIPIHVGHDRRWATRRENESIVDVRFGETINHTFQIEQELSLPPPQIVFENGEFEVIACRQLDRFPGTWNIDVRSCGQAGIDLHGTKKLKISNLADSPQPLEQDGYFM